MKKIWRTLPYLPHHDSPVGANFDWESLSLPHPDSPRGHTFNWPSADLPHPNSPESWRILTIDNSEYEGTAATSAGPNQPADPEIEALNLSEVAKKAAYQLKALFPAVRFTSGRRNKGEQASAMASNVILNRNWIKETYVPSIAREACQKWVDENSDKKTKEAVSAGLLGVLNGLSDAQLAHLSKHLSGDAFDVQPVEKDADGIKKAIRNLPGLSKFLEREGGLVRWHAQF